MEFSIVDCMFVIHDMEHLNKQLKLKFNITCEINNDEPEIKVQNIEVPEINIKIKKEIIKKEIKPEIKSDEVKEEIKEEIKEEVKTGPKTAAQRQRERRERLKIQLGEEEFKKQNQMKMKEYRAKQQKEKVEEEEEENDDDNVSTTSSNNNNKMRNEENMITCECGLCYHQSYKSRHLKSKTHIKGLEDKGKNEQKEVMKMRVKEGELLDKHKFAKSIKFVNSITDFDCRDNILSHENNEELYEELNTYINRFINNKCNEDQLNYDCYATIKEFVENNDIEYNYDFFSEYLSNDPYENDDESE